MLLLSAALGVFEARAQQGPGGSSSDPFSAMLDALKQGMTQPGPGRGLPTGRKNPSLVQVGLKNIMPQYDDTKPLSQQFPHVAITVLHSPPNWAGTAMQNNPFGGGFGLIRGCWTMTAVVLSNPSSSRAV